MYKTIIIVFSLLWTGSLIGQVNLDSLYNIWQDDTKADSIRTRAYSDYIWDGYLFSRPDTAFVLAEELITFGLDKRYPKAEFAGYTLQGVSWDNRSDYDKTLLYYNKALKIAKDMGNTTSLPIAYNNIGSAYHEKGDYTQALDYYIKSLEYNAPLQIGTTINNIATIYSNLHNYDKALEYSLRGLEINKEKNDKSAVANSYSRLGGIYRELKDYGNAINQYSKSLEIYEQLNHQTGIAETYSHFGNVYYDQGNYGKALENHKKSLQIFEQLGDKNGISLSYNNIGDISFKQGHYDLALDYCKKGYDIATSILSLARKQASCYCLFETHKALGNNIKALEYLEIYYAAKDSLESDEATKKLQKMEFQKEAKEIQEAHEEDIRKKERTRNISFIIGAFFLILAGGFFIRWRYVHKSKASLQIEKDRSEHLLHNILPEDVAQELKDLGKAAPRNFESVTILFTDFQDFTKLTASISSIRLVVELNEIFGGFDDIMDEYGIEKIETIGDAYLAVAGLPIKTSDHALKCVKAAFKMVEFLEERNKTSDIHWKMRLGIHSGPVIAGVVGKKKFAYDVFGDSVNTASRIETNGEVGKINISQSTYELIKNEPELVFDHRGKISAKGKGEIDMYFVSKKIIEK